MIPIGTNLKLNRTPKVTITLIVLNVIFYVLDFKYVSSFGFFYNAFIHADFFHLFFNMLYLWIFGIYLEDKIGWKSFLIFYFTCTIGSELLDKIMDGRPAIGASGAISGIMGIYLYRCYYSKIKTLINIGLFTPLFIKADINAKWLLGLYFAKDILYAFLIDDRIAYWAHTGGFLTGFIIAKVSGYKMEAEKDHLHEKANELIAQKNDHAEKYLLDLLKIEPRNPDIQLELARLYSEKKDKREMGKQYYLDAAKLYYVNGDEKSNAGKVFREYLSKFSEPLSPEFHLKYASTLASVSDYEGASNILAPLIDCDDLKGTIGKRVLLNLIKFSRKADLTAVTEDAFHKLKEAFPDAFIIKEAKSLMSESEIKKSSQILLSSTLKNDSSIREKIDRITSEPLYWGILLLSLSFTAMVSIDTKTFLTFLTITFFTSFGITYFIKEFSSSAGNTLFGTGVHKTKKEGVRDFNISFYFRKAIALEREKKFNEAVDFFKAVIAENENHLEARFRLARLYHNKMKQADLAVKEYKGLYRTAPQDHLYRREAIDAIQEISQRG